MGENLSTREVIEELSKQDNRTRRDERKYDKRSFRSNRKRVCSFCMEKDEQKRPLYIDYKDPRLKKYIAENGKILSRRQTGLCAGHQRELSRAIKVAQTMGLL
jgi:small subunit ribosomal protein S18